MKRSATATKSDANLSTAARCRTGTNPPPASLAKPDPISSTVTSAFMLKCIQVRALASGAA